MFALLILSALAQETTPAQDTTPAQTTPAKTTPAPGTTTGDESKCLARPFDEPIPDMEGWPACDKVNLPDGSYTRWCAFPKIWGPYQWFYHHMMSLWDRDLWVCSSQGKGKGNDTKGCEGCGKAARDGPCTAVEGGECPAECKPEYTKENEAVSAFIMRMPDILPCQACGHHARCHYVGYFGEKYDPVQEHLDDPYILKDAEELQHYFVYVHNSVNEANNEEPAWGGGQWTVDQMKEHYSKLATHKYNDITTGLSNETGESDPANPDLWMPSFWYSLLFSAYAGPQDETVNDGKVRLESARYILSNMAYIIPPKLQDQWLKKAEAAGIQDVINNITTRQSHFDAVVKLHNVMKDLSSRETKDWDAKDMKNHMETEIYACRSCNQTYGFEKEFCNKDESTCEAGRCLTPATRVLFA
jgi:hypothetical protein